MDEEFVAVGRIDNLASSFCCLTALLDTYPTAEALAGESAVKAIALFDHEEVGSASGHGALPVAGCCIAHRLPACTAVECSR